MTFHRYLLAVSLVGTLQSSCITKGGNNFNSVGGSEDDKPQSDESTEATDTEVSDTDAEATDTDAPDPHTEATDTDDVVPTLKEFSECCANDAQCASGVCGANKHVCTVACSSDDECPLEPKSAKADCSDADGVCQAEQANIECGDGTGAPCLELTQLPSEGSEDVEVGTEVSYGHNPPASGPNYSIAAKFGAYDVVVPRPYWVRNLEQGAVVFLYGPRSTAVQQAELKAAYDALPNDEACGTKRALLTPDPDLDNTVAVVAWRWVLELDGGRCINQEAMLAFANEHRGQGAEQVCDDGSFVP